MSACSMAENGREDSPRSCVSSTFNLDLSLTPRVSAPSWLWGGDVPPQERVALGARKHERVVGVGTQNIGRLKVACNSISRLAVLHVELLYEADRKKCRSCFSPHPFSCVGTLQSVLALQWQRPVCFYCCFLSVYTQVSSLWYLRRIGLCVYCLVLFESAMLHVNHSCLLRGQNNQVPDRLLRGRNNQVADRRSPSSVRQGVVRHSLPSLGRGDTLLCTGTVVAVSTSSVRQL